MCSLLYTIQDVLDNAVAICFIFSEATTEILRARQAYDLSSRPAREKMTRGGIRRSELGSLSQTAREERPPSSLKTLFDAGPVLSGILVSKSGVLSARRRRSWRAPRPTIRRLRPSPTIPYHNIPYYNIMI